MSDPLVIAFAEQKAKMLVASCCRCKNRVKLHRRRRNRCEKANGALKLNNSNASPFWEYQSVASGYPAPPVAVRLTDLGEIDKFVKEHAEAIPLGEAAVFVCRSVWQKPAETAFDALDSNAVSALRAALATRKKTDRH